MAELSMRHTIHWCRRYLGYIDNADDRKTHQLYRRGVDATGQVLLTHDASRKVRVDNGPYYPALSYCFDGIFFLNFNHAHIFR